jgi:hypothetical protein
VLAALLVPARGRGVESRPASQVTWKWRNSGIDNLAAIVVNEQPRVELKYRGKPEAEASVIEKPRPV